MGLFSKLKKLRLKDIGTGKNLKRIGQGIKQLKFGEGLGLLGLGLGGLGLAGAGPLGSALGGAGQGLGSMAGNMFQNMAKKQARGLLAQALGGGQAPQQMPNTMQPMGINPMLMQAMQTQNMMQAPQQMPVQQQMPMPIIQPNYMQQQAGGYGGGWQGIG